MKLKIIGEKGFTLGELLLVFIIVLIIGGLLTPLIRFNHKRMDKITCANNLRETGRALYIYAREHSGRFPESIQTLYDEQYLADEKIMDCPASKHVGTVQDPDYEYLKGLSVRSNSTDTLMVDKEENHPKIKNVLYVNGVVTFKER